MWHFIGMQMGYLIACEKPWNTKESVCVMMTTNVIPITLNKSLASGGAVRAVFVGSYCRPNAVIM